MFSLFLPSPFPIFWARCRPVRAQQASRDPALTSVLPGRPRLPLSEAAYNRGDLDPALALPRPVPIIGGDVIKSWLKCGGGDCKAVVRCTDPETK